MNESRHNLVLNGHHRAWEGAPGTQFRDACGLRPTVFQRGDNPMLRSCSTLARPLPGWPLALAAVAGLAMTTVPAQAQSSACQELAKHLTERKSIVESIQKLGGNKDKKMDPKAACAAFGKLAANGTTTLKWVEANKDWCQIPDQFIEGIKGDHEKVSKIRGQACSVAAKQAEMEKKAAAGQGPGGPGGLLGGGGLEGSFKMPQGAL